MIHDPIERVPPARRASPRAFVAVALAALLAAATAPFSGTARATTCEALGIADLAQRAAIVVHGEILDTNPVWNDDHTRIDTVVRIHVFESLKGDAGSELVFRCPGGRRDGKVYLIHGMPQWVEGSEVVLCVTAEGRGGLRVPVGLAQGAFTIEDGVAVRDPDAVNRVAPAATVAPECRARIPLAELKSELRRWAR